MDRRLLRLRLIKQQSEAGSGKRERGKEGSKATGDKERLNARHGKERLMAGRQPRVWGERDRPTAVRSGVGVVSDERLESGTTCLSLTPDRHSSHLSHHHHSSLARHSHRTRRSP